MKGMDLKRDLDRAIADLDEAVEVLRAEAVVLDDDNPYRGEYIDRVQRVTRECYALRNYVRQELG